MGAGAGCWARSFSRRCSGAAGALRFTRSSLIRLVARSRRPVEGEQRPATAEVELDGRLEAAMELEQLGRESGLRPASGLELLLGDRFLAGVECEQEVVGVSHHGRAAELTQPLEALRRLRAALRVVAEADDAIDVLLDQVGEERVERDRVAVDIREDRDPQAATTGCAPGTRAGRCG